MVFYFSNSHNKLHLLKVTFFFFTHFLHGLLLRNQAVTKTPLFTLAFVHALTRVLRGSSIFWIKINNLDLLLFEFSTFFNHKKKKNLGCNEIKKKN